MMMFGGESGTPSATNETWLFDGTSWTQVNAAIAPTARSYAMAGTLGGKAVMFGGAAGGDALSPLGDTWVFDGVTWSQVPGQGPPARSDGFMAPIGGMLLLFGGQDGSTTFYGDTWLFDGTKWTQVPTGGVAPPARIAASGGAVGGEVYLRGGSGGSPTSTVGLTDDWVFDGASWKQISISGPVYRYAGIHATFGNLALLTGGCGNNGDCTTRYHDTWLFDGTTWTQVASSYGNFAWDTVAAYADNNCGAEIAPGKYALTGFGTVGNNAITDVMVFDGTQWTHPAVTNPPLNQRIGCVAASL